MGSSEIDTRISNFLERKQVEFPELVFSGRAHNQRTIKYASELRASGQILFTH